MALVLVAVAFIGFLVWADRSREAFFLSYRKQTLLLVRGRVPQALLNDFADALRRQGITAAQLKAVRTPNGLKLRATGDIDDFQAQRLRNILLSYPLAKLSAAPVVSDRSWGQVLGIAWLAWLLDRR